MGFWDTVGSVAKAGMNSLNEYNAEMQALKARFEDKSSDELRKIMKSEGGFFGHSDKERKMAYIVLKQRGEV